MRSKEFARLPARAISVSELAIKPSLILACCIMPNGPFTNQMNCAEKRVEAHEVISARITNSLRDLTVRIDKVPNLGSVITGAYQAISRMALTSAELAMGRGFLPTMGCT